MFNTASAQLKWFMLPSEALEIMNSHHTNTKPTIKSPQPFRVKSYVPDDERQSSALYYPSSVPCQLIQSSWRDGDATSPAKCTLKSDESFHSNISDLYYSSNENDSDPEALMAEGTTVTGPSICFASAPATTNPEKPLRNAISLDVTSNIADGTQMQQSTPPIINNGVHNGTSDPYIITTNGMPNGTDSTSAYSRTESTSSLSHETLSQDGLSRHNSVDQQYAQCVPIQNYQTEGCMISTNDQQTNSLPCNSGFNGYPESSSQFSFSYPINNYSNPPNTPSVMANQCVQTATQPNPTWSQQQSFDATSNFPFSPTPCQNYGLNWEQGGLQVNQDASWGHVSSPVMTPSPVPSYSNLHGNSLLLDQMQTQTPTMSPLPQSNQIPTIHAISVNSVGSQSTPCLASPTNSNSASIENDIVNNAMRRVTNEIANELKSELRGVIFQMEQSIDDGLRERANSFTTKDKKVEALKRRTRTLSGHAIRFKRSEIKDETAPLKRGEEEKSDSNDESSLTSDPSSSSDNKAETTESTENITTSQKLNSCKDNSCCYIKRDDSTDKLEKKNVEVSKRPLKWHCPSKNILKPTIAAVKEYSMIKDGDKVNYI